MINLFANKVFIFPPNKQTYVSHQYIQLKISKISSIHKIFNIPFYKI